MSEITPADFDFDAWLADAERPMRSVTVYQKASIVADLDALAERIEAAELVPDEERSLGDVSPAKLRAEYAALAEKFHASALVVRVQGLTRDEQKELRETHEGEDVQQLGRHALAQAIVSPKVTPEQVTKFNRAIGDAQFSRIVTAYNQASNEFPDVSADFLPKPSSPDDTNG